MTYEKDMRRLGQAIRDGTKRITRTPETALAHLVKLGMLTADGRLTPRYGGAPEEGTAAGGRASQSRFGAQGDSGKPLESPARARYEARMPRIDSIFVTRLYRAGLGDHGAAVDMAELEAACRSIAEDDEAGQAWCEEHRFPGYTSYASLADLPWRFPVFKSLVDSLDGHVAAFAEDLEFDLEGRALELEDIWINVLPEGGSHSSHLHPNSVVSGTVYVAVPEGAGALKLEDPRSAMMMAAPRRRDGARRELQAFVSERPEAGEVVMWESWLRHEVPVNLSECDRISVSFNYCWP